MTNSFHMFGVEHLVKDGFFAGDWIAISRKVQAGTLAAAVDALREEKRYRDCYKDGSLVEYRIVHQIVTVEHLTEPELKALGHAI